MSDGKKKKIKPLFACELCGEATDGAGLCLDCLEEETEAECPPQPRCNEDYDRWDYYAEVGGEGEG